MEKIDLGKPTTPLNDKMNRKDLHLNVKKTEKLKNNLIKQFNTLNSVLSNIDSILGKLNQKDFFEGDVRNFVVQCSKKCSSQAQAANSLVNNLEQKYSDDVKSVVIKSLDERISYLEEMFLVNKK